MAGEMSLLGSDTPFDMTNLNDPRTIGLLGAAASLLQAGGPSATPVSFGQAMGQGIQGGIRGLGMGQQMQLNNAHMGLYGAQGDALRARAALIKEEAEFEQERRARWKAGAPQGQGSAPGMNMGQAPAPGIPQMPSPNSAPMQPQPQAGSQQTTDPDYVPLTMGDVQRYQRYGKDMLPMYKLQQEGFKKDGGAFYEDAVTGKRTYFPTLDKGLAPDSNGNIVPVPGYADANARIQGAQTQAQEQAKAGLDMIRVPLRGGGERLMSRADAARLLGGGGGSFGGSTPGASGFGETQAPADQEYQKEAAKTAAEQYKTYQTDGMRAPGLIAKYQRFGQLLENHNGGKLSGLGLDIASAANSLGFNIDENLPNKEAALAIQNDLIRNTASTTGSLGAGVSNTDVEFSKNANANMLQTPEGRKAIIDFNIALENRKLVKAQMARKWQQRFGRIDAVDGTGKAFDDYLSEYAERNPLVKQ